MKAEIILTDNNVNVDLNEPVIDVSTEDGFSVTIIGGVGPQGAKGDDYVLTEGDKDDIAEMAAGKVDLQEYVRKTDYPQVNRMVAGVVKVDTATGIGVDAQGLLSIYPSTGAEIKAGTNGSRPITPKRQYISTFYGLAKAAGVDEKDSELEFGTYTDAAKTAIRAMLGATSLEDIPEAPVQDVHVNGTSVLDENGVADIPIASDSNPGVVKVPVDRGLAMTTLGNITLVPAPSSLIKTGEQNYYPITPKKQHEAVFYGLAKAAGSDEKDSTLPGGQYTTEAKAAIQTMLGVPSTADVPVEAGTGVGSAKTKDFEYNNVLYSNEASGQAAFAEGRNTVSSSFATHAEGYGTKASSSSSHAEGSYSEASGMYSHAEGYNSKASGTTSHAEGNLTMAVGACAHAEGSSQFTASFKITGGENSTTYSYSPTSRLVNVGDRIWLSAAKEASVIAVDSENATITLSETLGDALNNASALLLIGGATGNYSHTEGQMNTASGLASHAEGSRVVASGSGSHAEGRSTKSASQYQHVQGMFNVPDANSVYADIVGNGTAEATRSNARALSWEGDERLMGDVYVECNPDSSGGTKLAKVTDIPTVPVTDVQVNGTSVLSNGVANVPMAGGTLGVVKKDLAYGVDITGDGRLLLIAPTDSEIRRGLGSVRRAIQTSNQHAATFYGLAKAAGDATQSQSTNAVGTYTDDAKTAIRAMLGLDDQSIVDIVQAGLPAAEGVSW